MYHIVGLGNPGVKYKNNRHNVGFKLLDYLVEKGGQPTFVSSSKYSGEISEGVLEGQEIFMLKPDTFMNKSGSAVQKAVPKAEVGNLIVVYDDIDLPLGEIKVSVGRGDGGHNGIKSIVSSMGSKEFVRLRIGIAPKSFWTGKTYRPTGEKLPRHVLGDFKRKEEEEIERAMERAVGALRVIVTDGPEQAMNQFN